MNRRKLFAREYVTDLNGSQAALRSGYSAKTCRSMAYRLLHDPMVVQDIQKLARKMTEAADITAPRVLEELARIGFADITALVQIVDGQVRVLDTDTLTADQRAAIAEISMTERGVRVKLHDKAKALEDLGRYLKLFTDKTELSGKIDVTESLSDADLERIAAGRGE